MTRDQQRARHAFARVEAVPKGEREDYKVLVFSLGPNVIRSGLAAALTFVERDKAKGKRPGAAGFLRDLGDAGIPGLAGAADDLPARVRALADVQAYMLATREVLRLTVWFRRAVQAIIPSSGRKRS